MAVGQIRWPTFPWAMLALSFALLITLGQTLDEGEKSNNFIPNLSVDLRMEDIMHQINRFKRAAKS